MYSFLRDYRLQSFQNNHHRLSLVRNDLPQTFLVAEFPTSPTDLKLARLMARQGWHNGIAFPQYGYGGALGLTIFVGKETTIDPDRTAQCIGYMAKWQMQLNAWSRELIGRNGLARKLSRREIECLTLVAEGKTSRRIAEIVGISTRTVEFHIQNAIHKLGGHSRSQAASMLVQLSLPQLGRSKLPAPAKH
jgi:DNA-binding CsgD family transcriptional regulator